MRRKVFAFTALLALLIACGAAYAASSGSNKVSGSVSAAKSGSTKKPAVTAVKQSFKIKNATSGQNAYPTTNILTTISNLKVENAKAYPTCTAKQISKAGSGKGWNKVCNSKSLIATGPVNATIYTKNNTSPSGDIIKTCKLTVNVYNAGSGKLTFFLTTTATSCGGLPTGTAAPWTATYKESKGALVLNVPLPADVSTNAGNLGWSAINSETLNFKKLDTNKKPVIVSTGKTHAWKMTFTYSTTGKNKVTTSIHGG